MSSDGLLCKGAEDHSPPVNNNPSLNFGPRFTSQGNSRSAPVRFSGLGMPLFGEREKSEGSNGSGHHYPQSDVVQRSSHLLGSSSLGSPSSLSRTSIGSRVYGSDVSTYRVQVLSHSSPVGSFTSSLSQQPLSRDNDGTKIDSGENVNGHGVEGGGSVPLVSISDDDGKTETSSAATESQHGKELEAEPLNQSPVQKQATLFVTSSSDQTEDIEHADSGDETEDELQTETLRDGEGTLEHSVIKTNVTPSLESHKYTKNLEVMAQDTTEVSVPSIPAQAPFLSSPLRDLNRRNDQSGDGGTRNKVSKRKSLGAKDNSSINVTRANYEAKIAKLEQLISHYEKNDAFLKRSLRMVINDVMDQETRVASLYGKIKDQNETSCQVRRLQELLLNNSLLVESACSTISRVAEEGRLLIKDYERMKAVKSGEDIPFKVLNGQNKGVTLKRYTLDNHSEYSSDDEEVGPLASAASRATWRRNNKKFQGTVRKLQAEIGNLKNQLGSLGNAGGDTKSEGLSSVSSYRNEKMASILRQLLRDLDDRIAEYSSRDVTLQEKIAELSRLQSSAGTKSLFEESDYVKSLKAKMLRYNSEVKTLRTLLESRTNNMKVLLLQRDKRCSKLQEELNSAVAKLDKVQESERNASSRLTTVVNTAEHQRKSMISIVEQFKSVAAKLQSSENAVKNLEGVVQAQAEYIRNLQKFVGERSAMLKPEGRVAPPIAFPAAPIGQYTPSTTNPDSATRPTVPLPPGFNRPLPTAFNHSSAGPETGK